MIILRVSIRIIAPPPQHAALPAESLAARPVSKTEVWVYHIRTGRPPSLGSLAAAPVPPGHAPTQGLRGAPELAPGGQGVHLQPPPVRAHLPAARAAQVRVHSHCSRWVMAVFCTITMNASKTTGTKSIWCSHSFCLPLHTHRISTSCSECDFKPVK